MTVDPLPNTNTARPAFFLDRDGTLNIDHDYVHKPEEWDWVPGVPEALQKIQQAGYLIIVITNQSGVARGKFSLSQVHRLHRYADRDLERYGVKINGWYIAPWHPDFHKNKDPELLAERKPGTALFERAAKEHRIDFSRSFMVGDKATDLKPALQLGIEPYLVVSRFMNAKLKGWAQTNKVPVLKDLPQVVNKLQL